MTHDGAPRAVAYVRVSDVGDRGADLISPELQLAAIERHCTANGYAIVRVLEDLDLTGRFWKRRQVETAIAMIERHEAEILVVWKLSRVARNRLDWAIALDRVESVGGRLESATEAIDATTSTGRFTRGMLAELAAFESERIGDSWRETHARRVAMGLAPTGRPKWGYVYDPATKRHEVDPVAGPILAECFARYLAGTSFYALTDWLHALGMVTTTGAPWTARGLRAVMDAGFAAGLVPYRGALHPGAHAALIDPETWARYQEARGRRRRSGGRSERSQYLLSGLVRCELCQRPMVAANYAGRRAMYRCRGSSEMRLHPGGYIRADIVEAAVLEWLRPLAADLTPAADEGASRVQSAPLGALAARLSRLDGRAVTLARRNLDGIIEDDAYVILRDEINAERETVRAAIAELEADAVRVAPDAPAVARDLLADWDLLGVAARREALKRLIRRVEVTPGRLGSVHVDPL